MNERTGKIYFIHEGKEAYPEIAAYKAFFAGAYETQDLHPRKVEEVKDLGRSVAWHIMGFYPKRPRAALVVHDYRSLSVGRTRWIKDRIKRYGNARPDVRIFQNAAMRDAMGFRDNVATTLLPMGVSPEILSFREEEKGEPIFDFCYMGAMSAERKTEEMIDSFLRRYGGSKTFVLYGTPEPFLLERYKNHKNIIFAGRLPQRELFPALRRARAAVNYFPVHAPHSLQTPTKLLEYAALGLRILSNEQPQSRLVCEKHGVRSLWGSPRDMFAAAPDALDWETNETVDPSSFLWPGVIARSGIAALIEKEGRA